MSLKYENELVTSIESHRKAFLALARRAARNEALPAAEIEAACAAAAKSTESFRGLVLRIAARQAAADDLKVADQLRIEHAAALSRLETATVDLREEVARHEAAFKKRREAQLQANSEADALRNRESQLRESAVRILRETAGDGDPNDVDNVRIDDEKRAVVSAPAAVPAMTFRESDSPAPLGLRFIARK